MARTALAIHPGLRRLSRLPPLADADGVSARELATLLACGAAAALLACLPDLHLRVPGHAILRSVFPMAFGLALVPRRGAGLVMGATALAVAAAAKGLAAAGVLAGLGLEAVGLRGGAGVGALTSMSLTGPLLDLALWGAHSGWRLYAGVIAAAVAGNLAALAARAAWRAVAGGGRPFADWIATAAFTYPLCGLAAGLLSALVWFHLRGRDRPDEPGTAP